jgi:hypothetical protein
MSSCVLSAPWDWRATLILVGGMLPCLSEARAQNPVTLMGGNTALDSPGLLQSPQVPPTASSTDSAAGPVDQSPPSVPFAEMALPNNPPVNPGTPPGGLMDPLNSVNGMGEKGGMGNLSNPHVGSMPIMVSYRSSWFPDEPVRNQGASLGYFRQDLAVSAPIWQNASDEWSINANVRQETFNTGAVFPNTLEPFPNDLWEVALGTGYRHQFDNGWILGGHIAVGSASDQPFSGIKEMTASANASLRVPVGETNAWLFSLSYSPTSQLSFPIPGVAFLWNPNPSFQAVLGVPLSLTWKPTTELTLQFNYMLLTNVNARATYRLLPWLRAYAAFTMENESYFPSERVDTRDRLFYYDNRVFGGMMFVVGPRMSVDLSSGYVFNRFYFEGHGLQDSGFNRVDVGDGPYVGLQFQVRY